MTIPSHRTRVCLKRFWKNTELWKTQKKSCSNRRETAGIPYLRWKDHDETSYCQQHIEFPVIPRKLRQWSEQDQHRMKTDYWILHRFMIVSQEPKLLHSTIVSLKHMRCILWVSIINLKATSSSAIKRLYFQIWLDTTKASDKILTKHYHWLSTLGKAWTIALLLISVNTMRQMSLTE